MPSQQVLLGRKLCALTQVAMIAASCTPLASMLILSWLVVVVVGVACCCCIPLRLVLMLVLTFAPCTLTFGTNTPLAHVVVSPTASCTGVTFSFSLWRRYSTCTHGGSTLCNLRWWHLSLQPLAQILYLHTINLHSVVVVVCGCGSCSYE